MFCSKCGANNADEAKFCIKCGASLTAPVQIAAPVQPATPVQPVTPVQPAAPVQPAMPVPPQNPKKNKTGLIIGIVAGVVALIAIISVIVFFAFKDKNEGKDDESSKTKVEDTIKTDDKTNYTNNNGETQTDPVDTKHDSKVVGKWKSVISEDIGDGNMLEMVGYFDFNADGTCKVYFNPDEVEKSMTDALYSSLKSSLGGLYTNEEIDELLAQSGEISIAEMVDGFMQEFNENFDMDGYWETENGMMYDWDKTENKEDEEPDKYTVSADGKTMTITDSEGETYTLERV